MNYLKGFFFTCLFLASSLGVVAQEGSVEMADTMRSNGRIYVVIAVMLTILAGLIFYIARIDRKISRIENDAKH